MDEIYQSRILITSLFSLPRTHPLSFVTLPMISCLTKSRDLKLAAQIAHFELCIWKLVLLSSAKIHCFGRQIAYFNPSAKRLTNGIQHWVYLVINEDLTGGKNNKNQQHHKSLPVWVTSLTRSPEYQTQRYVSFVALNSSSVKIHFWFEEGFFQKWNPWRKTKGELSKSGMFVHRRLHVDRNRSSESKSISR